MKKKQKIEEKIQTFETEWKAFKSNINGGEDLEILPDHALLQEILVRGVVSDKSIKVKVEKFLKEQDVYKITSMREIIVDQALYDKRRIRFDNNKNE